MTTRHHRSAHHRKKTTLSFIALNIVVNTLEVSRRGRAHLCPVDTILINQITLTIAKDVISHFIVRLLSLCQTQIMPCRGLQSLYCFQGLEDPRAPKQIPPVISHEFRNCLARRIFRGRDGVMCTTMALIVPKTSMVIRSILNGELPRLASLESALLKLVLRVARRRSDVIQARVCRNAHSA
jgi:hypothetical protein